MNLLRHALAIARKDLRVYFRDRTGMALGFLLPLVLVAVFGFMMKLFVGQGDAFSRATLWVTDQDRSDASRDFLAALRQAETLKVRPAADESPVDETKLRQDLTDGELHHALLIPAGFGAKIAAHELPELRLLRDPDRAIEEQLISIGVMQAAIGTLGPDFADALTTRMLERAGIPAEWRTRTQALAKGFAGSVRLLFEERDAAERGAEQPAEEPEAKLGVNDFLGQVVPIVHEDFRPPERPKQMTYMLAHSVSGIGVMMLMFGLVACASQLLRERESGTLPRLLAAPMPRGAILWGKYLFALAIGALQLVLLFGFGAIVFQLDVLRAPVAFLVVCLAVLLAVTSFGMLIAAWAATTKQAEGLSTLVILVMSAVGGAWFPLQAFDPPMPVQIAMRCTLTHWAISSYQALFWYGQDLSNGSLQLSLSVLLGFTVVATITARWLFERRYVGR